MLCSRGRQASPQMRLAWPASGEAAPYPAANDADCCLLRFWQDLFPGRFVATLLCCPPSLPPNLLDNPLCSWLETGVLCDAFTPVLLGSKQRFPRGNHYQNRMRSMANFFCVFQARGFDLTKSNGGGCPLSNLDAQLHKCRNPPPLFVLKPGGSCTEDALQTSLLPAPWGWFPYF